MNEKNRTGNKISPETIAEYKYHHANAWPEVNARLKASNIQNYSIYYRNGLAFAYMEYVGDNFAAAWRQSLLIDDAEMVGCG